MLHRVAVVCSLPLLASASSTLERQHRYLIHHASQWYAWSEGSGAADGPLGVQPNANDIKRRNANFAAKAQAGKRTVKAPRADKRSTGLTVLIFLGFLLIGGSECCLCVWIRS